LEELDRPGWLGRIFQKTWVLALALVLSAGAITVLSFSSGERRKWKTITKLDRLGDERDAAILETHLREYLRRYEQGPHADEAREMLPRVERERQRRQFARSPVVSQMRPSLEGASELEQLYRRALLQLWIDGEAAARATLEQVVAQRESAGAELFLVELAEEDLLSLDLQRVARLRAQGEISRARVILEQVIERYGPSLRHLRWVRHARQALAELDRIGTSDAAGSGSAPAPGTAATRP
jgi:hypothetical protein